MTARGRISVPVEGPDAAELQRLASEQRTSVAAVAASLLAAAIEAQRPARPRRYIPAPISEVA